MKTIKSFWYQWLVLATYILAYAAVFLVGMEEGVLSFEVVR